MSPAETYCAIRLHNRSDKCWAVVANRTGAILIEGKHLMMRLARTDAERIAADATRAASLGGAMAPSVARFQ